MLEPLPEPGGADHLLGAVQLAARPGSGPRARPARAARPSCGRADRTARRSRAAAPPARARGAARKPARPRFVNSCRATLSGRRAGSRRRTETTSAPASSAFSHSVAAAIPAPTIATRDAYSCGSYACTARGSPSSSAGQRQAGVAGSEQDVAEDAVAVELEAAVHRPDPLDAGLPEALVPAAARSQLVDVGRKSSTVGR